MEHLKLLFDENLSPRLVQRLFTCIVSAALAFATVSGRAIPRSQGGYAADLETIATWVTNLQYSNAALPGYGAVRVHNTVSAIGPTGKQYYTVSPYSANLALIGLLQTAFPTRLQTTERWMHWFTSHLTPQSAPDGVPYTHFSLADGSGETVCVTPGVPGLCKYNDATDSAAATFFSLLWAYHQAGGASTFFTGAARKTQLEHLAKVVLALQQSDGLMWAKADYKVKYLEDNCEVYDGLRSLAHIETTLYHDAAQAQTYNQAADRVQHGILTYLYMPRTGLYSPAKFEDGTFQQPKVTTWYPDMQSQFWPHLFGVVSPTDPKTQSILNTFNRTWNGAEHNGVFCANWATTPDKMNGGFVVSDVAYGALLAGDRKDAIVYLAAAKALKYPDDAPTFPWPFPVSDAGWLLRMLAQMH